MRHPLYSSRIFGNALFGLISFPFGTFFSARSLYHNVKGCEKQDERMRILHGEEAVKYQNKVPAMVPGTKLLMMNLRKVLPKKFCDILDTPVSHYLEIVPNVRDENYYSDEWITNPGYHKGEPTYHIGTSLERRTFPNGLTQIGKVYAEMGKDVYRFGMVTVEKIRKKIRKSKRRKYYLASLEQSK